MLRPDSHFVFTVESCAEGATDKGFRLLKNGRFGYSKTYISGLIAASAAENMSLQV